MTGRRREGPATFSRLRLLSLLNRAVAPGLVEERRLLREHHQPDGETCPVCGVAWPCPPVRDVAGRLGVRMAA